MTNTYQSSESGFDPLLIDIKSDGSLMSIDERVNMWMSLKAVSDKAYALLVSDLLAGKMERLQEHFRLNDEIVLRIGALIRDFYVQQLTIDQFRQSFTSLFGSQGVASEILSFIESEVFTLKPPIVKDEKLEASSVVTVQLLLLDALGKYARLNDAVLSLERIRVKSEREPVRGTVRNWLRAYRDVLGVRKHTALERGQFLFQSENGKLLSNDERERVSLVLKSLDENTSLAIDPGRQEIVFPINPGSQAQPAPAQSFQSAPATAHASASSQPPEDIFERRAPRAASVQPTFIPSTLPQSQAQPAQLPKNNFNFAQAAPVQPAGIRFSSGHTLPSEKQEIQQRSFVPEAPVEAFTAPVFANLQAALQAQAPQAHASFEQGKEAVVSALSQPAVSTPPQYRMPPRIRPAHFPSGQNGGQTDTRASKKEVWEVPAGLANVVDLRSDEESVV